MDTYKKDACMKDTYTILSFDIGIKNLAYCNAHYNKTTKSTNIIKWDVIDIINNTDISTKDFNKVTNALVDALSEHFPVVEDNLLIENQPCMKNPMMKSLQMIIYSWFLIRSKDMNCKVLIKLLSASNKLKVKHSNVVSDAVVNEKNKYKKNKKSAIEITTHYLTNILSDEQMLSLFKGHKKRDDLADSFLQLTYFCETANAL